MASAAPNEPVTTPTADTGLYVLLLTLRRAAIVTVRSKRVRLEAGTYAYVGSAKRALRSRVERHLRRDKPLHWHVDTLTSRRDVHRVAVVFPDIELTECELNRRVEALVGGTVPVPGFGASDCKARCPAHLWRCGVEVLPEELGGSICDDFDVVEPNRQSPRP